jgi:monovalent cation:H+ antiporter-2, CPA2 family
VTLLNSAAPTIIAGYGLPGRAVAQVLRSRQQPYCVIELNPSTVERCEKGGTPIIEGDCRNPEVLKQAGIEHATMLLVLIPDEKAAVEATIEARKLNPLLHIFTRCHYTSTGIDARAHGANEVIVAEQIVAEELLRRLDNVGHGKS